MLNIIIVSVNKKMLATSLPICCRIINKDNLSNTINIIYIKFTNTMNYSNINNKINIANMYNI